MWASNSLVVKRQSLTGAICLSLSGEVDLANASELLAHFKAVVQAEDNLIVDMSGLRYLDSSGIKALLNAYQQFTQIKRRMVLAAAAPWVHRILTITGLDQLMPMFPTVEEALSNIRLGHDSPLPLAGS
jgi:anti-anti-sigma factor